MPYQPKKFEHLIGTPGFSDQLLKNHFTLYEGYVTNVNKLTDALGEMTKNGKTNIPEYAELKRRFGWEWNGMKLHELYFENMGKKTQILKEDESRNIEANIKEQFGSYDAWLTDFKATGAMRGIGWTILYQQPETNNLFNIWVNEHDMGHLAGCTPLLVLDVFEHAYTLDYGIKKADYLEAFIKAIDWAVVSKRFTVTANRN